MLSVLGAAILWIAAYFFFTLILLGLTTAATGDWDNAMPSWVPKSAGGIVIVLFVIGLIERRVNRYAPLRDRPIIGWHVIPELLLLPVKLTFASVDNLRALRFPNARETGRAWDLLCHIRKAGAARMGSLALVEPHPARLMRRLELLQLVGFIDLHHGEDDWFFTIRGNQMCLLDNLIADCRG